MAPSTSEGCCSPVVTDPNHAFTLYLGAITVEGTGTLDRATVQLYLDDTSNGPDGLGNTVFIRLDRKKHAVPPGTAAVCPKLPLAFPAGDGMRTEGPVVVWPMQGSMHNAGRGGVPHPMPDVAKVVVTGETIVEVDGRDKPVHGVLGGALVPLDGLLKGLASKQQCFRVPIYNGFMDHTCKGKDGQSDVDTRLVTVAFHALGSAILSPDLGISPPGSAPPGSTPPGSLSDAVAAVADAIPCAQEQQMDFQRKRGAIFKPSSLPTERQSRVLREFLPPAINTLWLERIDQGLYPMPTNAPANFTDLNLQDRCKVLDSEPGKAMFRAGGTPNARIAGQVYPHIIAAMPGMSNETEQPAITNKRLLVHAYHAALTMFKGYGWGAGTLFQKVADQELDEELTSFLGFVLSSVHTLPSTQEYVSDRWLFKDPFSPLTKKWSPTIGEDWQVANASMASWSPEESAWSPSGHHDCESKAHYLSALYLGFVDVVGGKGNHWIQDPEGMGMEGVRASVVREALQLPIAGAPGRGAEDAAGGVVLQPIGAEARHSILAFAKGRHALFQGGKLGGNEAVLAESITLLAALFASDSFQLDMILGEAFGAAATSERTRKAGGHAYAIATFCGQTALLEGTGSVLNRMHAEHAEHVRSIMRFEAGLSMAMEAAWNTNTSMAGEVVVFVRGSGAPVPVQPSFRPMMLCSSAEHTEGFYGKALVASRVKTFREIRDDPTRAHGAYLFTKDTEVAGRMEFGVQPEDPLHHSAVYAEVKGLMVDQAIAGSTTFQSQVAGVRGTGGEYGGGAEGGMSTHPFTTSLAASVSSLREIGGQRIPFRHWARWMGRMYGEGLPEVGGAGASMGAGKGFSGVGRVARVVVTFRSREELVQSSRRVRGCWMALQAPEALRDGLAEVERTCVLPTAAKANLVHAQQVAREIEGDRGGDGSGPKMAFDAHETLNTIVLTCRVDAGCGIRRDVFTGKAPARAV